MRIDGAAPRTLAAVALLAGCATLAAAQKGHASPTPAPRAASPSPAPAEIEPAEVEPAASAAPAVGSPSRPLVEEEPEPSAFELIPWGSAFSEKLHNKIVHFPIALGMAAAVMLMVAPRWPAYSPAARVLLVAAGVAAIAAYLTGTRQEEQFRDSPFHAVVELHEAFGIGAGLTLWAGVALTFVERARRFLPVYGALLLLVLAATGFLGGVLSHS